MKEKKPSQPFEVFEVHSLSVVCDGGRYGHPRVFLRIDPDRGEITCPYCSRQFILCRTVQEKRG